MKNYIKTRLSFLLISILAAASIIGCTPPVGGTVDSIAPKVVSTIPMDLATGVATNSFFSATFDEAMLSSTITDITFTSANTTAITGTVAYSGSTATFTPSTSLEVDTLYTATISTGATDLAGNAMAATTVWSFTTAATAAAIGPMPVILGTAGNYAILAETMIRNDTTGASAVTGNMGLSPAATTFVTGFVLTPDAAPPITYATTPEVVGGGRVYAADMAGGSTSSDLSIAIGDKLIAYNDAAGRSVNAILNLGAGTIGGEPAFSTFVPGLYNWNSAVNMTGDITLAGGANDVWIFQINGTLDVASAKQVIMSGGALAKNVFWQVTGITTILSGAHFEGVILCASDIWLLTGATMNGRTLSNTQVILQSATVTQPAL